MVCFNGMHLQVEMPLVVCSFLSAGCFSHVRMACWRQQVPGQVVSKEPLSVIFYPRQHWSVMGSQGKTEIPVFF